MGLGVWVMGFEVWGSGFGDLRVWFMGFGV